jgi:hypothetical protein
VADAPLVRGDLPAKPSRVPAATVIRGILPSGETAAKSITTGWQ